MMKRILLIVAGCLGLVSHGHAQKISQLTNTATLTSNALFEVSIWGPGYGLFASRNIAWGQMSNLLWEAYSTDWVNQTGGAPTNAVSKLQVNGSDFLTGATALNFQPGANNLLTLSPNFNGSTGTITFTAVSQTNSLLNSTATNTTLLGFHFQSTPAGVDNTDNNAYLSLSRDGTNWTRLSLANINPTNATVNLNWIRNGHLFEHNGKYYYTFSHINPSDWLGTSWGLARCDQGLTRPWTLVGLNDMTDVPNCQYVWTTAIYVDAQNGVHAISGIGTNDEANSYNSLWYQYATDTNNLTTWSNPTQVTGYDPTGVYCVADPWLTKEGENYVLWWVSSKSGMHRPMYATSTNISTGYTPIPTDGSNWMNFTNTFEAISLVRQGGVLRIYGDNFPCGQSFVSTSTNGTWAGPWSQMEKITAPTQYRALSVLLVTNSGFAQDLEYANAQNNYTNSRAAAAAASVTQNTNMFFARKGAPTQAVNDSYGTLIAFTNVVAGPWGFTNSAIFTNATAGWYNVSFSVFCNSASTTAGSCNIGVLKNGTASWTTSAQFASLYWGVVSNRTFSASSPVLLAQGDYLAVVMWQTTGGVITVGASSGEQFRSCYFSVTPLY